MSGNYQLERQKSNDAIDEDDLVLCFACCCANASLMPSADCCGCSGKLGLCCCNIEMCCKPNAPCLPLICCGPKMECEGCSCIRGQMHCCCCVVNVAVPCSEEIPLAVTLAGLTIFPFRAAGCCKKVADVKGMTMAR